MIPSVGPPILKWLILTIAVLIGGAGISSLYIGEGSFNWIYRIFNRITDDRSPNGTNPISVDDIRDSDIKLELHQHHHYERTESQKESIKDDEKRR